MTSALAQRELGLASVALLAAVLALALGSALDSTSANPRLPESIPAPGGGWYTALAAARGKSLANGPTACGHVVGPRTLGVAHPVLPCDIKLYISYRGREVLTQVIGRGPYVAGRDFELTASLGAFLDLEGTQPIRWRYAG